MKEIKKLAKGLRVAIYGAGEVGITIKGYIEKNRPDLKIVCFFDKTVKDKIDGINVYCATEIPNLLDSFDTAIIASYSNTTIMEIILKFYGVKNYINVENVEKFLPKNKPQENERLIQVKQMLHSKQSRNLFELIVYAYRRQDHIKQLTKYLENQKKKYLPKKHEQYLDFVNKDAIKTMISGGAFDAGTSLLFLDRFKDIKNIYAFEPMYENFKCEVNDKLINRHKAIEIIQKGLFDKSTQIFFDENSSGSKINPASVSQTPRTIQTISIDEFVQERNIKKVDFIKMDIEGAELNALKGSLNTIINHRPQLAICLYHSYNELFDIPLYLNIVLKDYRFEVYHYSPNTFLETVLYAIPNELAVTQ